MTISVPVGGINWLAVLIIAAMLVNLYVCRRMYLVRFNERDYYGNQAANNYFILGYISTMVLFGVFLFALFGVSFN